MTADRHSKAIARRIAGAPKARRPFVQRLSPRFTRGLVCAFNADGTLLITMDGGASAINADALAGVDVDVGDVVELHTFGTRILVDGYLSAAQMGWQDLELTGHWVPFGSGYRPPQWRLSGKRVFFRGLVANPDASGTNEGICFLPIIPTGWDISAGYGQISGSAEANLRLDINVGDTAELALASTIYGTNPVVFVSLNDCSYWID